MSVGAVERPLLHFTARDGWINDPLAVTQHGGRYHLFFQHVPGRTSWEIACSWGHATSSDLLRWSEHPVALAPGDGDDGVWSGSLALRDERPVVFYTSVRAADPSVGIVRSAEPLDGDWTRWRKGGTVLEAPEGIGVEVLRDPFVLRSGGGWRMLVGAGLSGGTAAVLGWSSADLERWTFDGVVASRPGVDRGADWTGTVWECPQLIEVDGVPVLLVSVWGGGLTHHVVAAAGVWDGARFVAGRWHRLSHGDGPYATTVFRDEAGRACAMSWLRGASGDRWTGALSVPHVLTLRGDRLVARPHPLVAADDTVAVMTDPRARVVDVVGPTLIELSGPGRAALDIAASASAPLRLEHRDGELILSEAGVEHGRMPSAGACSVLIDGPVVEAWSSCGVLAFAR